MRLAIERQARGRDRIPLEPAEAVDGERPAELGVEDGDVIPRCSIQRRPQARRDSNLQPARLDCAELYGNQNLFAGWLRR